MRRIAIALLFALTASGVAQAQSLEDRLRNQLTVTTSQLRELQASQAGLAAQKDAAEKARDALQVRLAAAEARLRAARAPSTPAPAPVSSEDIARAKAEQLAQDQAQLDAAVGEGRRLTQELAQLRAEHDQSNTTLAANAQGLLACQAKHAQVFKLAEDLLAAFDDVTRADMLVNREPFTGLKRVQSQRREQDFADRLYDGRLDARPKAAPAPVPPQAQ